MWPWPIIIKETTAYLLCTVVDEHLNDNKRYRGTFSYHYFLFLDQPFSLLQDQFDRRALQT